MCSDGQKLITALEILKIARLDQKLWAIFIQISDPFALYTLSNFYPIIKKKIQILLTVIAILKITSWDRNKSFGQIAPFTKIAEQP